ncbi:hypothetical protein [Methylobacterium nonmethylotrophicum]|uniref:Uncharacterized protein n=1 Tax=Methylobacterium nonmethylotrophicum TaxID=1141884 RepID=A0A4Z0NMA5_9HYPH|nr:hypothetical protein [Methylobacterium nonmethylotrophicum]TGD97699.1 hypothetical protein EU555_18880 [Methylobacterium nonmethylotrophicum]
MNRDRQLARLMAVVIVMIAACFGASVALAHEGHAHHAPAPVKVSQAAPTVAALPAKTVQAVDATITISAPNASVAVTAVPVSRQIIGQVPGERPCNGVCCSMGASCCALGLLPDVSLMPLALAGGSRVVFSEQPAVPSLAREALPKPPRSFA